MSALSAIEQQRLLVALDDVLEVLMQMPALDEESQAQLHRAACMAEELRRRLQVMLRRFGLDADAGQVCPVEGDRDFPAALGLVVMACRLGDGLRVAPESETHTRALAESELLAIESYVRGARALVALLPVDP